MPKILNILKAIAQNVGLIDDYIVESGETGIWRWKKYKNGDIWCWGIWQGTISPYTSNNMISEHIPYGYVKLWGLPFNLRMPYEKFATVQVGSGAAIICTGGLNDTSSEICFHWASSSIDASRINMLVIGKTEP